MKKYLVFICTLILSVFLLCGCGEKPVLDQEALQPFVGKWDCRERPLEDEGKDDYYYVGYFTLRVEEDGIFSMYDGEAGNPGIEGEMYPKEDGTVLLHCGTDDFDPPFCWSGIENVSSLQFAFKEENGTAVLHLSYTNEENQNYTLVFDRMD